MQPISGTEFAANVDHSDTNVADGAEQSRPSSSFVDLIITNSLKMIKVPCLS